MSGLRKRIGSILISIALIISVFPVFANAAGYSDISGHWAKAAIVRWSDYGVLKGSNGHFRPDDTVTRAELAVILQRILKYPAVTENPYSDIKSSDWYASSILALAKYDIVRSADGRTSPNEAIDREEAAFMIGKAFGVKPYQILYKEFSDSADISPWAEPFVCAMYHYGFVNGMESGVFQPKGNVTRAQVATILNNMVGYYISTPGTYDISSTDSKVLVNCNGVNLKFSGCTTAKLFVSPGVNNGTLTEEFSNCGNEFTLTEFDVGTTATNPTQTTVYPTLIFTDISNTEIDTAFAGGKGTPDDPYLIETQDQLRQLNNYYAAGFGYYCSPYLYFKLNNDITISGNWTPIADQSFAIKYHNVHGFFGELNGDGHTVSYNIEADDSKIQCPGLFGGLCGLVRNLNVKASISGTSDSWTAIGGVAGDLTHYFTSRGIVQNCNADMTMNVCGKRISAGGITGNSLGTIYGCSANVKINAVGNEDVYAGGIVGCADGDILNCSSEGSITSQCSTSSERTNTSEFLNYSSAGGVAGFIKYDGEIGYCHSTAEIHSIGGRYAQAGGIVGTTKSVVSDSYATGIVTAQDGKVQSIAGGLIGCIEEGIISDCWASATVNVSGNSEDGNYVGGCAGCAWDDADIVNCWASAKNVSASGAIAAVGGFIGHNSGQILWVYVFGAQHLTEENALINKNENYGTVEASYNFTNISTSELNKVYEKCGWPFDKWNKDCAIYPVLRGVNEAEQIKAMLAA